MRRFLLMILGVSLVFLIAPADLGTGQWLQTAAAKKKKKKKKKNSQCRSKDTGKLKGKRDNPKFVDLTDEMCREIEERFPKIHKKNWAILEWGDNGSYNCFAHSVGVSTRHVRDAEVNPKGTPTLKHWDAFYAKHGLKKSSKRVMSKAIVVMYGDKADTPVHAARLSKIKIGGTRMFESKLGPKQLLLHHVHGLKGGSYGKAIRSYK